jgi:hypothetical protein
MPWQSGASPLHVACVFAHIDLVKVLIENRADVQAKIVVRSAVTITVSCVAYLSRHPCSGWAYFFGFNRP